MRLTHSVNACVEAFHSVSPRHALTPARFKALKALDKLVGLLSNQPEEVSVVVLTDYEYTSAAGACSGDWLQNFH